MIGETVKFTASDGKCAIVIEDDGRVGYAYLLILGAISAATCGFTTVVLLRTCLSGMIQVVRPSQIHRTTSEAPRNFDFLTPPLTSI